MLTEASGSDLFVPPVHSCRAALTGYWGERLVELVDISWLDKHLGEPGVRIVDPRPIVKYLSGHVPGAVNLPISKTLDQKTFALLPEEHLSEVFGRIGIDVETTVVLCDSYDGQNAAMLAWVLEYLGHRNVKILSSYVEAWATKGRELLYRPVLPSPKSFDARPNPAVRIRAEELVARKSDKLLDLRSAEEFQAKVATEVRSGHIPGAVNLPWTSLLGSENEFLKTWKELDEVLSRIGIRHSDEIVTYCSYGPRAAIGYIALQHIGYKNVRVYDGSFHEWAQRSNLPVEGEGLKIEL